MSEPKKLTAGKFTSSVGFVLAAVGSAVGMGNIWLFPYRVGQYGGGAFLIPYFIFVALFSYAGLSAEFALGRMTGTGTAGSFDFIFKRRGWKGGAIIGTLPLLGVLGNAIGYSVVVGWILKYLAGSFTGALMASENVEEFSSFFGSMASSFGNNFWQIIGLAATFAIMIFGIASGIEKANKIMMPLFFLMFLGLAVYMAFQPGSLDGYRYIFRIDPKGITDPMTWVFALGQAFFSLSLAGNGTLIYGSYLSDKEDIVFSAGNVALFDTLAAMLSALVIIPAMATTGSQLNQGGPGLMFIYLPNLFKSMPGSTLLLIVFFAAVFLAGITSLINLFEAPIATLQEHLKLSRAKAVGVIAVITLIVSLCIQGIVSDWMDFVSIYICPLGAGLAGIMFFWVLGKKFVVTEVSKGRAHPVGEWYFPLGKYLFCGLTILVFVLGIIFGGIG